MCKQAIELEFSGYFLTTEEGNKSLSCWRRMCERAPLTGSQIMLMSTLVSSLFQSINVSMNYCGFGNRQTKGGDMLNLLCFNVAGALMLS